MEKWESIPSEISVTGTKKVKLVKGDKVYILNIQGKKEGRGVFIERGSAYGGHDRHKWYCIKDLKDNSIKWVNRSDIRKIPSSNWE